MYTYFIKIPAKKPFKKLPHTIHYKTNKPLFDSDLTTMAEQQKHTQHQEHTLPNQQQLINSYLGISFSLFLTIIPSLETRNQLLSKKLLQAEEQLDQLYSRRKEDSKANARVVEIFASHRHGWQQEEKRLLTQIDDNVDEITNLRNKIEDLEIRVEELKREVSERDELLNFMTNRDDAVSDETKFNGECYMERGDEFGEIFNGHGLFDSSGFSDSGVSKFLAERSNLWQGVQYESLEPVHDLKHYVSRRESPWKVDGDSSGVSAKLKLLEQELQNLENIGANDLSKVPSLMKKQTKRYQTLAGKIDDLCRRMQENDPCEPNASLEFRTQRQTEFLLEALRLQQRASETGQKLMALQTDCNYGNDLVEGHARLTTRLSLNSIKNNFRDIQRNLEIWLARIIGDVEGILARDGASRVKEYFISPRYPLPLVQQERFLV